MIDQDLSEVDFLTLIDFIDVGGRPVPLLESRYDCEASDESMSRQSLSLEPSDGLNEFPKFAALIAKKDNITRHA